ncbi:hypothetical protein AURDEDRAFT_146542 [Auricularia subglabra TFB-10046 SS5]|nr:hypothetical protein AURDEDRAFT_146542 [Auricularia subglabra TFB-10046 SS5]
MFRAFRSARRFCHRCWHPAHTAEFMSLEGHDTHFNACQRCQLSRYCGRECQLADWKHGEPVRHRAVCPLLARIRWATNPDMPYDEFEAALVAQEFTRDEMIMLSLFTLNPKLVYLPMLVRAADIHRDLLGDAEYPPDSVKALALVDVFKKTLDDKRAGISDAQPR